MNRAKRIGLALAGLVLLVALVLAVLDTQIGHRLVADRIAGLKPSNGLQYSIGRIDGSLYGKATLVDVRVSDPQGVFLAIPRAELDWSPAKWIANRLDITSLVVPRAVLMRAPRTLKTGRSGPILPGFDIRIGLLRIDRLVLGERVTGVARHGRVQARADIRGGRALLDVAALVEGSDRLRLKLDAEPDRDRFDIDVRAQGIAGGVLSRLTGIARPLALEVAGDGKWSQWAGAAKMRVGDLQVADLRLDARQGRYQLSGDLVPSPLLKGKLQRISAPRVRVMGDGTLVNRRLNGSLSLRSAALDMRAEGEADLATSAWRNLKVDARLLQPQALFPNMTGRNIVLRAILDGPFATARFDYRLLADRFAFDNTGFEQVRAAGRGRLSKAPVVVPIALTAARVTGIGDVAGGILRNLSVAGALRVTPTILTGDALRLKSDKLTGSINLVLDLRTGKFDVGINGRLGRYLIPGLGIVDVTSKLSVVPGPNGRGTRVVGTGTAQVLRLDNGFFASLSGGLPRIVTGLERGADGILYFRNLQLVAPKLRLSGNGYRRRDGSFHFEGGGTQASYGPLTLVLDGRIDKPTLDLVFARPNEALSLRQVRAHLDPTPEGFAFRAAGGSVLGPFTANGAILLPRGQAASIRMDALDVSGTRASGTLRIVAGGFEGRWGIAGGGLSGELLFRPVGQIQRIEAHVDARDAKLGNAASVRRGRVDMVALLDPAGTHIEATATATGLRRGALSVARFAGNIKLRGGDGEARASIAGSQGRAFDIQSVIGIRDGSYSVRAQGSVDRRPLQLQTPAVLTRDGDGWRLAPTRLTFAGGSAQVAGRFGGASSSVDATLARMPLSILDIGYPGLGLGGNASGKLTYSQGAGAPTGRIDMTVRGLTRAGLVLSSRPIDMGIAGVLAPDKAAFRAVMASGGKTIGRAQGQLAPLGQGGLSQRIARAPLFAQLRYDGPADTLWRLTGVELFDLSGPVAVGADARGTLSDPQISGTLRANGARIESATTGTVFTNVQATGRFGGSRLVIDRFAADAGKGRVSGAGAFDFGFEKGGIGIDLTLDARNARMIDRDDIGATVTGGIAFRSDGRGGTISGDVRLDAASFRLGQASAAAAVPRLNIREINGGDAGDAVLDSPATPWRLDLHAKALNNVRVTGLGLDSDWSADLRIGGVPSNPAIGGRADLVRGSYEFAGRDFELERGSIRFDGSVPADPTLDIVANADATGLNATIRVGGTGQRPEISFASVPALPQDELLSRLLFGTSITNLSAPEALQLAAAVAALQGGTGSGLNPINAVRRAAGLDRLRILPADPQTGQQTSVAAGKYITRNVYGEIITDAQGYSATRLEFQVTRWLSLLGTISTIGRQSANVRVSKDY